jgi:glycosyltransferase involved in cell wall biosynthesis
LTKTNDKTIQLSAVISAHNEEKQLSFCLESLIFADEIVVLLDRCSDGSESISRKYTDKIVLGEWEKEGQRRNAAIEACQGLWILEIDADERVSKDLAIEVRNTIDESKFDWHEILVDNYIGGRLVRRGWGASFGKAAYPGLFRNGVKEWGLQRVHPNLKWTGKKGPRLRSRLTHLVDHNISDMIKRLDNYSSARAKDLRDSGEIGSTLSNMRRFFSRFIKCSIFRRGYREGGYGLIIAICAGLFPLLSHLKAKLED